MTREQLTKALEAVDYKRALYLAIGIDPEKCIAIYEDGVMQTLVQDELEVSEHLQDGLIGTIEAIDIEDVKVGWVLDHYLNNGKEEWINQMIDSWELNSGGYA